MIIQVDTRDLERAIAKVIYESDLPTSSFNKRGETVPYEVVADYRGSSFRLAGRRIVRLLKDRAR